MRKDPELVKIRIRQTIDDVHREGTGYQDILPILSEFLDEVRLQARAEEGLRRQT